VSELLELYFILSFNDAFIPDLLVTTSKKCNAVLTTLTISI